MTDRKPMDDLTVVDLSDYVTGAFAGAMLANQGADVVKVERPDVGDRNRASGPPFIEGESPYYWTLNYGKRSLELDLKDERGLEALYDLVEAADVLIQNFRPGTAERLGIDYDTLCEYNEDLIYCTISGFGETGPLRDRPGYDLLMQGMSGIMSVTGEPDGDPVKVGVPLTDLITSMWAGFGIVTALRDRERTGEGQRIELGMLDAAVPWLTKQAGKVIGGDEPERLGSRDPVIAPYQAFETADGYINLGCNQRQWVQLCEALGREDLLEDDRFETNADRVEHVDELEAELERTFRERTTEEWVSFLTEEHGIPTGPLWSVEEVLDSEQIQARGMVGELEHSKAGPQPVINHPLNFSAADGGFERHAPALGEHTREVLGELGYDEETIDDLVAEGVFGDG